MSSELTAKSEKSSAIGSSGWFTDIISAVNKPISFMVLIALVVVVLFFSTEWYIQLLLVTLLFVVTGIVCFLAMKYPGVLMGQLQPITALEKRSAEEAVTAIAPLPTPAGVLEGRLQQLNEDIYGAQAKAPNLDRWFTDLLPTLHQAVYFSIPTYFLDPDLYILDYNSAFELIFRQPAQYLRGRHVNWLIAQLDNHAEVHSHGRSFTEKVQQTKRFPLIDMEPITYESADFGRVEFTKIASQLNDRDGKLQGWAVALMVKQLHWSKFEEKLRENLRQEKLWGVYAPSYDRILPQFPPYNQLISDVLAALSGDNLLVADLGAGTGNVTKALLEKRHRVVAIENNIGMLEQFRAKQMPSTGSVTIIKDSIQDCERLKAGIFDGVVMVNVLYAVDDPLACLKQVNRLLKPGGMLGMSTTHRETRLDQLLAAIQRQLEKDGKFDLLKRHFLAVDKVNREIEESIARRRTQEQYLGDLETAGFAVVKHVASTYENAVMLVHARKSQK